MFPISDVIPSRTTPVVNSTMIGLCALAFLSQVAAEGGNGLDPVERYGLIPVRLWAPDKALEIRETVPVRTPSGIEMVQQTKVLPPATFNPWLTLATITEPEISRSIPHTAPSSAAFTR